MGDVFLDFAAAAAFLIFFLAAARCFSVLICPPKLLTDPSLASYLFSATIRLAVLRLNSRTNHRIAIRSITVGRMYQKRVRHLEKERIGKLTTYLVIRPRESKTLFRSFGIQSHREPTGNLRTSYPRSSPRR
jgi:hypothetical protein